MKNLIKRFEIVVENIVFGAWLVFAGIICILTAPFLAFHVEFPDSPKREPKTQTITGQIGLDDMAT
jgi:hypothetical protein